MTINNEGAEALNCARELIAALLDDQRAGEVEFDPTTLGEGWSDGCDD